MLLQTLEIREPRHPALRMKVYSVCVFECTAVGHLDLRTLQTELVVMELRNVSASGFAGHYRYANDDFRALHT